MKFVRDIDRPEGGRFRCSIDPGHVMSLRDDTIFEGLKFILFNKEIILIFYLF
jgi:hypothetical protein